MVVFITQKEKPFVIIISNNVFLKKVNFDYLKISLETRGAHQKKRLPLSKAHAYRLTETYSPQRHLPPAVSHFQGQKVGNNSTKRDG